MPKPSPSLHEQLDLRPEQSIELLQALHIVTREGKINQDSRRKLKQVNHLLQFIAPLIDALKDDDTPLTIVDHGAGKSYLGFMLYDRYLRALEKSGKSMALWGIETRAELVTRAETLAREAGFSAMKFLNVSAHDALSSALLPARVDIVTALHACDTATDDAIAFALTKRAKYVVLVPCCQAEMAAFFREDKGRAIAKSSLSELWKHPIQAREFGAHLTNVLRGLRLEAHGYKVTVTELVGWEHSMKNELIVAELKYAEHAAATKSAQQRLRDALETFGVSALAPRFE